MQFKRDPYNLDLDPYEGDKEDDRPNLAPDNQDWEGQTYVDVGLPQGPFLLHDTETDDIDGPFDGRDFVRDEETGAFYTQTEGRPLILRVIKQEDDEIWSEDGSGHVFHYAIVPNVSGV